MATAADDTCVVETIKLTKVFKDFWGRAKVTAVDNLDLRVYPGEVFGLLGPNGSGKTTTIKMLLGLLYPSKGQARVFGRLPTDVAIKTRIGYLPEETRLYQFLDSWETLDFYGRLFRLQGAERRRRAEALLDMVGLGIAARRQVGQYSKGMARRIGLAQSLINDPDLLILDEPTAGMDPIGTRQIKDLILELRRRGKTILLSSHLLADVEDVCDRIAVLYGGKLLCCDRVDRLLAQEDLTEIVLERLDEETADALRDELTERLGKKVVSVGTPRHRLERFFLNIVEQAQKELPTSGSVGGGRVGEFLRAKPARPTGGEVLEHLVAAAEPAGQEVQQAETLEPVKDVPSRPTPDKKVLEGLVNASGAEPQAPQPRREEPKAVPTPSKRKVDKSVLDKLVDKSTQAPSEKQDQSDTSGESSDATDLGHR